MSTLAERIAVVTGASRGIGKSIAVELAEAGARVACFATRAENAAETVAEIQSKGGEAIAVGCRVESGAEVTRAFAQLEAELGAVDILVNNAGVTHPQLTLDMTEENWDLHMNVNAKSIFLCSQAAARQMGSVSIQLMLLSLDCEAEFESVDEQPNDEFVHLNRFREANGFSH
jgi:3-oxoacyl-[acyl-carrier protein] reductase